MAPGLDEKDGKVPAMGRRCYTWLALKHWKCIIHSSGTQKGMMSKLTKYGEI
jgi:hypothetical protein